MANKYKDKSKASDRFGCLGSKGEKFQFSTKDSAEFFIKTFPKKKKRRPVRAYHCKGCGKWHVTSKKSYAA